MGEKENENGNEFSLNRQCVLLSAVRLFWLDVTTGLTEACGSVHMGSFRAPSTGGKNVDPGVSCPLIMFDLSKSFPVTILYSIHSLSWLEARWKNIKYKI